MNEIVGEASRVRITTEEVTRKMPEREPET
jgi:hypothetical protein